jgi:iron(II)-dependent oxidoreductase
MAKQRPGPSPEPPEIQAEVHLKPFLGMRPGVYLTVLYSVLLLAILFFLLFYKGLRDHGTFLEVVTFPPGASVSVDDQYAGSTPCVVLVRAGERTISVSKPFFANQILQDRFAGPVFGTLFVRPRLSWNLKLQLTDSQGLVQHALRDFANNPQIPEILMETVQAGYAGDNQVQDQLYAFLDKSKYFITSPMQLPALTSAFSRLAANHHILTAEGLLELVEKIIQLNEQDQNFPFWLALVLPENVASQFIKTPWYKNFTSRFAANFQEQLKTLKAQAGTVSMPAYRLSGLTFHGIPAGVLLQGSAENRTLAALLPHAVQVQAFLIAETELPSRLYRAFVQAVPEWRKGNIQSLIEKGMVTEDYLEAWTGEQYPAGTDDLPVTGVSWFAAQAFCRWFSDQMAAVLPGYSARVPTESEWEWAARGGMVGESYPLGQKPANETFYQRGITGPRAVGSSAPNGYGLRDMSGNVWEWCADWYSPVAYLFSSWKAERNPQDSSRILTDGADKSVRGGSWTNDPELVKLYTRASQPPSWCTPYLGFRVVLSKQRS